MKLRIKIFLFILLIVLLGFGFLFWKSHHLSNEDAKVSIIQINNDQGEKGGLNAADENDSVTQDTLESQNSSDGDETQENATEERSSGAVSDNDAYIPISPMECDTKCVAFNNNPKELAYCRQVCGISENPDAIKKIPDTCDNLSGLDKDYCLKDIAVSKDSLTDCDKIEDENIRATCKNRITEDLLN